MNRTLFTALLLTSMIILHACKKNDPDPEPISNVVTLGAILDLSGDYSEAGLAGKAAIEIAIGEMNQRYASVGSSLRFACSYTDTHLDTTLTQAAAAEMYAQGIRILVAGPNNSAGLKCIQTFLNEHQMLAVTCFSSSPSLAINDDYIYRLITDDFVQGQALVRMMGNDTIRALVPIWREDTYGTGLHQTVKEKFEAEGGYMTDGVSYSTDATNYAELIQQVTPQVTAAITAYGASHVAVLLITYQEAMDFMKAAAAVNDLSLVKWYGCDANVQRASLVEDPVAGPFAQTVRFLAPIMGIGTAGSLPVTAQTLSDQIFDKTGLHPDAYALSAYDAVQIIGLAYNIIQANNAALIKTVVPKVCESYDYLGISRKLNAAGDLAIANYIFWTVVPTDDGLMWDSYATYMSEGDYILLRN